MDLQNLLSHDGDVNNVRAVLSKAQVSLKMASYEFAKASLCAANEAYLTASNAKSRTVVWNHLIEAQMFMNKTQESFESCIGITGMILTLEESGDDDTDNDNATVKAGNLEQPLIFSLIEGAAKRMQLAQVMLPDSNAPGAKCDPTKLTPQGKRNGKPNPNSGGTGEPS